MSSKALWGVAVIEGDFELMLFVLLSAHCWLRPNEGLQLLWEDVSVLAGELLTHGVVRIGHPKIKRPPVQHVLIEAKFVADIVKAFKKVYGTKGGRICRYSPTVLATKWRAALVKLRIEKDLTFAGSQSGGSNVAHSLTVGGIRPGVATSDYLRTQNHSRTMWRGRWACAQTLRHYLQLGTYYLTALSFSPVTQAAIASARCRWFCFVEALCDNE
jgi:hypothetical protein